MDQPLKQRLIGVTLVVALVVIFVPMLFEKSDDKGKLSTAGIPSIPEDVMEKPLELPKTAEDLAPKEDEKEKKASAPSGFTLVPFNEEPPKPKPSGQSEAKNGEKAEGTAPAEGEAAKTVKKPGMDSPAATVQPTQGKPAKALAAETAVKKPAESKKPSQANAAVKPPQPAPDIEVPEEPDAADDIVPAQESAPSLEAKPKPSEPVAKKSEAAAKPQAAKPQAAKSPASPHPVAKPVKLAKPAPPAPSLDLDDEEDNAHPAKPEVAAAKPKTQAAPIHHPTEPVKKAEPAPAAAHPQQAKAAASKPAAAPAKPAQAAAKAPPKKPSAWVVQAGSFTDEAAARTLADKLKQSKLPASVQTIHGEHGSVYKVQVAEPDRGRAEETLKQIAGSTGINGTITERH